MQIFSDKLFENPIKIIEATSKEQMKSAFAEIEKYRTSKYLVGFISYDFDYLYFEVFDTFKKYVPKKIDKPFGILSRPIISQAEYLKNIERIKNFIADGITYEVNYTYPNEVLTNLTDIELYDALLTRQKTPYNAFLQSDKFKILSFSPELFFTLKGNKILTKPMKGTIKRGKDSFEDSRNEQFLYQDEKNRAENVMIVDLLRNDLGKIAQAGSVKVEKLFEIEKHSTLFQMTSEVSAQLEEGTTLYDIFEAIFPCGSITGAPKLSTMDVIEKIEPYNRGIYCGAIGFLSPEEVVFSVPIRILQASKNVDLEKSKSFVYNVGGAIVWDSNPQDEWDETLTKMEFLNTKFQLIETFNSDFKLHIERMKNSASELGFLWNKSLETIEFKENTLYRIVLEKDGKFSIETPILKPRPKTDKFYVRVCGKVNSLNPFLYHKTSIRASMPSDVYDEIRTNEFGQLTEGTFTNIAVQIGEKLYTPPKSCGLLNGILRQKMLESSILSEKVLYLEDLKSADKIFCFNSVRGFVEVELC